MRRQSAAESQQGDVTKTVMRVLLACKPMEAHRNSSNVGLIRWDTNIVS